MAYSVDYRKRAIEYYYEGHTQAEVRAVFKVYPDTIREWEALLAGGSLEPNYPLCRKKRKLPDEELILYINEHPDAFLFEIGDHFNSSGEAVRKALKKLNITLKKNSKLRRTVGGST